MYEKSQERYELSQQVRREMAVFMVMAILMFVSYYFTRKNPVLILEYALEPRSLESCKNILIHPFIHSSEIHLYGNLCMFLVLSNMITVTRVNSHLVILILYIFTGLSLWLLGNSGRLMVGLSAFCFAEAGFLFVSAAVERTWWSLFVSITALSVYGFAVWSGMFNAPQGVSALGHIIGFLVGVATAVILYKLKK